MGAVCIKKNSAIEYFKKLIDVVNSDHFDNRRIFGKFKKYLKYKNEIAAISFFDSMCVIEKYKSLKMKPFARIKTGKKELIINDTSNKKKPLFSIFTRF